jgi:nucleoside-diphosphate-sugar epimerase
MKTALVTGATGLIGSALIPKLLEQNVQVFCLVRRGRAAQVDPAATPIEVPSAGTDALKSALAGISAEIVFHLASYGVQAPDRDREQLIEGNIRLTANLLEAVADWPIQKFLFAGSCSEYAPPESNGKMMEESYPLQPSSIYGAAKAAAELYGRALAAQLQIPFTTLRLFNVYGPGEGPHRLIPFIVNHLLRDRPAELTGGAQIRDFLHVDDVASALTAAGACELQSQQAYNVCSSRPATVREVGEIAADVLGKSRDLLQWGKRPYRSDEPMWVVGDNAKFTRATGWKPRFELATGVRKMVEAIRHEKREPQHAV